MYCDSWGHKESDTTEWLNWTDTGIMLWLKFALLWWLNKESVPLFHNLHWLTIWVSLLWTARAPSGSAIKNPPAIQETSVTSLGQGRSLGEGNATHPGFLPGESYEQKTWLATIHGLQELDMTQWLKHHYCEWLFKPLAHFNQTFFFLLIHRAPYTFLKLVIY